MGVDRRRKRPGPVSEEETAGPADRPACYTGTVEEREYARRRLEHLYEVSKLLLNLESVVQTVDAALGLITATLPLRSAILIEARERRPIMTIWPSAGMPDEALDEATANARAAFDYLIEDKVEKRLELREQRGTIVLPAPAPGASGPVEGKKFIVLPLVVGHRPAFGALQLESAISLHKADLVFVNSIANQLSIALDRHRARELDISLRRRAEDLTLRYEALVDNLDHAFVWQADARSLQVSYVSARAETLLGYPRRRWLDEPDFWTKGVHPLDSELVSSTFRKLLSEGRDQRCDHRFIARDGRVVWLHTGIHLANVGPGSPIVQAVSVDVTPAKQAEEALSRAVRMREQVLAIVSHDLRNPLSTVEMSAAMLLKATTLQQDQRKRAALIMRSAQRMGTLISDLADFASIESGHLRLRERPYRPRALIQEALAGFEAIAQGKQLRLVGEAPDDLPLVRCDRDRVLQVFSNLIGNAVKITPAGGFVAVRAEASGAEVHFTVSDTGPGIAPEDLERIFDRYWRGHQEQRYAGSGLGLAIARGIVEAQGGRIWAESTEGAGSRFSFTIPASMAS